MPSSHVRRRRLSGLARLGQAAAIAFAISLASQSAPAAEPVVPTLSFVFEETVRLGDAMSPGKTAMGGRNIIPITGGTFEGPGDGTGIKGIILPGGWDWQLQRADGCLWLKADYMLKTDDGAIINIVNQGPLCPPKPGQAPAPVRTAPVFEPPIGKYAWLGQSAFIGTLEPGNGGTDMSVKIRIYRVN